MASLKGKKTKENYASLRYYSHALPRSVPIEFSTAQSPPPQPEHLTVTLPLKGSSPPAHGSLHQINSALSRNGRANPEPAHTDSSFASFSDQEQYIVKRQSTSPDKKRKIEDISPHPYQNHNTNYHHLDSVDYIKSRQPVYMNGSNPHKQSYSYITPFCRTEPPHSIINKPSVEPDKSRIAEMELSAQQERYDAHMGLPPHRQVDGNFSSLQKGAGLLLSCWCGDTFVDTLSAFGHCQNHHQYSAFLLLHRTLAQLLSSDHGDSLANTLVNPAGAPGMAPRWQAGEADVAAAGVTKREAGIAAGVTDVVGMAERLPAAASGQTAQAHKQAVIQLAPSWSEETSPGLWMHCPADPSKFAMFHTSDEGWKEAIQELKALGWGWGKGPVGTSDPRRAMTFAQIKTLVAAPAAGEKLYACPGCNITGGWGFIRVHLRVSGLFL